MVLVSMVCGGGGGGEGNFGSNRTTCIYTRTIQLMFVFS